MTDRPAPERPKLIYTSCMILQAGLLLLVASTLQASEPEPTKTSVLPPGCGLTEEQVLLMAIPKYHELVARSNRHDPDSWFEDFFEAFVAGAVKTNLGFAGRSFLIVAISVRMGECDGCYSATLMAIDLRTRMVAWRFDSNEAVLFRRLSPEYGGNDDEPPVLRAFRMFPDDPVRTVAFQFWGEDPFHGTGETKERWLRPRVDTNGLLTFDVVWEAAVFYGTNGAVTFTWGHQISSEIRSLWPRRAYLFTRHTRAGWDDAGRPDDSLDLMTKQEFTQDPVTFKLLPGRTTLARRDKHHMSVFPFNLPMRALVLDPAMLPPPSQGKSRGIVLSPTADLFAERVISRSGDPKRLRLCRTGEGEVVREVWSGRSARGLGNFEELDGLYFHSIGWTADGTRCLAIVGLGLEGVPPVLVSLTPDGKGDRWEGFLPEGYVLPDGFILDLPEPDSKSGKVSANP